MENAQNIIQNKMSDTKRLDNENMRRLLLRKYIIEMFVTGMILGTIIFLSYNKFIDGCTTGTLLGTIVGYTLKDLRKYQNKS